ncbi:retinol dehydrogenase 8 [Strongylocentrotus purpuratus]|uniref:Uncharacterized protein n=1 Tax=Strongylocentrotus purpuratus TaxID=7668 RepID=A0A7M7NMC0_STRPU|nr:retinol dehydrogenase 8 [Strongylocentrotus purpuratus]
MSSQIVLMTGCSSGIGLATAKRLALDAEQRYIVIATVIAISEKTDLEAAVGDALQKTIFIQELDVTKDDDITAVVDGTLKTHGKIDILINVAGIGVADIPERVPREQIETIFSVNVFGAIRLTQAVLPRMKQRKAGKIITISSTGGKLGYPYLDMYCSTKFALEGFFQSLAVSLRSFNVRVCLVEPGGTNTGFSLVINKSIDARLQDESIDDIDRRQLQCLRETITKNEIAWPDDVADAITTRCLDVDEPVLGHLLPEELHDVVRATAGDVTGETGLAIVQNSIGK